MANVVALAQIIEGFYEGRAIVHDNLTKSTPSAKNILEYPIANGLCGLSAKNVILGIVHERAVALDQIFEATRLWKVYCIHINLHK